MNEGTKRREAGGKDGKIERNLSFDPSNRIPYLGNFDFPHEEVFPADAQLHIMGKPSIVVILSPWLRRQITPSRRRIILS